MQAGVDRHTRVLVVDDQPADLAALERHLAPFGLNLVKASSGEEALEHFGTGDFALVLMDVRLPGLNGIETARRLHEHLTPRRVPLIFLTGAASEEESVATGDETGAADWLRTPVDPRVPRAKVGVFVSLHREREALRHREGALYARLREALERRSRQAEAERERLVVELREAVRLRDEFLSVASHELKTPLTPLALRLQLMSQGMEADEPDLERLRAHVKTAQGQVRRLGGLVDSLLDVTRITGGRLTLRREEGVNLAALVRDVAASFAEQAARVGSPLELSVPARVVGHWDVLRLEQVVTNLLSNALKFGAGGTIHLSVTQEEGQARLSVRDEGIGMSAEVLARIFGRFERGVSERHYGGLGLGLYISRQVVQALGGHIHVESAPGRGSTFTVELPCAPREDGSGGAPP